MFTKKCSHSYQVICRKNSGCSYLDRKNTIIDRKNISKGGVSSTVVDTKIIFKFALEYLASGLILVHNHPSENRQPSDMDVSITNKVKNAALLFDMNLLDHAYLCRLRIL